MKGMYDPNAQKCTTPGGIGILVEYDRKAGMVTVEMDYMYLVSYSLKDCVIHE